MSERNLSLGSEAQQPSSDVSPPSTPLVIPRPVRPKYQVFVSATFSDLEEARREVMWAVLKLRHIPVGMENFSAQDDRGWDIIRRTIDDSDYYVVIIAGRYGSIDPRFGKSWTEREYDYAVSRGIPVLAFLRELGSCPGNAVDRGESAERLDAFRKRVESTHHREMWTNVDDLRAKVSAALTKHVQDDEDYGRPRPGWYRGPQTVLPEVAAELASLSAENRELRARLADDVQTAVARAQAELLPRLSPGGVSGSPSSFDSHWVLRNPGGTPFEVVEMSASWSFTDEAHRILTEHGGLDLEQPAESDRAAEVSITDRIVGAGDKQSLVTWASPSEKDRNAIDRIWQYLSEGRSRPRAIRFRLRVTVRNRITGESAVAEAEVLGF